MKGGGCGRWDTRARGECTLRVSTGESRTIMDPKKADLQQLFDQYTSLFHQRPGQTELVQHTIHLTPSRQQPYQVPDNLMVPLQKKIETMWELEVNEPSMSEWSTIIGVRLLSRTRKECCGFALTSTSWMHSRDLMHANATNRWPVGEDWQSMVHYHSGSVQGIMAGAPWLSL